MTEDQRELLEEAHSSLGAATLLLNGGYPGYAVSRAYYAMFYVAEAFLEGECLSFSKHSGVIAAFGQHFAHTGKVPVEFHRFLLDGQKLQNVGDYDTHQTVTATQARTQIHRAEQFLNLAERLIGPLPPTDREWSSVYSTCTW